VIYIPVAFWYVKRIRSDNFNLRLVVENHFENQIENSYTISGNDDKDLKIIIKES
jgi:hypothetical protein